MPHKDPIARAKYMQEYHKRNAEKLKAYQHEWYMEHRETRLRKARAWKKANREKVRGYSKKYQQNYPDKRRAHDARTRKKYPFEWAARQLVYYAVLCRIIEESSTCDCCGALLPLEAHHDDYNYPLNVRWLCKKCHTEWHASHEVIRNELGIYKRQSSMFTCEEKTKSEEKGIK